MTSFNDYTQARRERVNAALIKFLPSIHEEPKRLHEAMHYVVLNGGKRLRPLLVYMVGEALGADVEQLDIPACAVEFIHTYSLVHDDLPAMDDDDLRRGKPTCHKAYDEATAILVGDALQTLAFQILVDASSSIFSEQRLKMVKVLAMATGSLGMTGGQALDLQATGKSLPLDILETLYNLKTGALFSASIELGLLAANYEDNLDRHDDLRHFAKHLGLAFQIQDDILDVEGDVATFGKEPGHDEKQNKLTYPTVAGLKHAKSRLSFLQGEALKSLSGWGSSADHLRSLTENVLHR